MAGGLNRGERRLKNGYGICRLLPFRTYINIKEVS